MLPRMLGGRRDAGSRVYSHTGHGSRLALALKQQHGVRAAQRAVATREQRIQLRVHIVGLPLYFFLLLFLFLFSLSTGSRVTSGARAAHVGAVLAGGLGAAAWRSNPLRHAAAAAGRVRVARRLLATPGQGPMDRAACIGTLTTAAAACAAVLLQASPTAAPPTAGLLTAGPLAADLRGIPESPVVACPITTARVLAASSLSLAGAPAYSPPVGLAWPVCICTALGLT